ncbi:hypothetical protein [Nocardioides donggukensis]|uniref:Bacterial spore germination immunoglobulin-like domain-containing protein n=1 Tax=Nocardioides donggukensis TaxID=2774019 RepID=A0A927Q400_9ACTN|nr:hypothetical protein [Nocardioides donggukensis]MBD8871051.1 hypothetical protein [Nocardioides donggukensis]
MRASRSGPTLLRLLAAILLAVVALAGCSSDAGDGAGGPTAEGTGSDADFPDITGVEITAEGAGTYRLDVTVSSPYDSPDRYADGWRVLGPDREVLGEMTLGHDHASEQPFTRTQTGVQIPEGVSTVTVEGHDTENGYGGGTAEVEVPPVP